MQLRSIPKLTDIDVSADHSFVFDAHNADKSELITRYRGTALRSFPDGDILVSWQKSIYHFGGITREVPIFITIRLNHDETISSLEIDERSNGSQGRKCSFPCLESCIASVLKGKCIYDIPAHFPSAVETKCLHIYEILSAAASFYSYLKLNQLKEGTEQELFVIEPTESGIIANNKHEVLGITSETELLITHNETPVLNEYRLADKLNSSALVRFNGSATHCGTLKSDNFESSYAQLNRLTSKCYHLEKKYFDFSGRIKFSNCPAMAGLFLLSISHEGLEGTVKRALEIEKVLHYLQTGYGDHPCKGFGG